MLASVITAVDARLVRVPLAHPVFNATARIEHRDYLIVQVESDSGEQGVGFGLARDGDLAGAVSAIYGPRVVGSDAFAWERTWDGLWHHGEAYLGRNGAHTRALSVLDIAVWDLRGKLAGLSLAQLLGGAGTEVPVLVAVGYYAPGKGLAELADEYRALLAEGFTRFKLMVGGASLAEDVARVLTVREALGDGPALGLDVNGAWPDAGEALRFVARVHDAGIDFVEEPFRPDNLDALRRFRAHCDVDVAVGEWEAGRRTFARLIRDDLIDVVRADATNAGGIGEWTRIAALATSCDRRVLPHEFPAIHAHLVAATPGAVVEIVPRSSGALNLETIVDGLPTTSGGSMLLPTGPGLSLQWNAEALDRFTVVPR